MIGVILANVIWLYLLVLTARAILSLVPLFIRDWQPRGVLLVVAEFIYTLTDPPLRRLRRIVPPVQLGGVQLDLAFLVLYLGLTMLMRLMPLVLPV
ncbi:MAG TPA: YggT family protein [Propionicimonas sp.]|nr:YggT family protein [Propionicimonas sp.]